MTEKVLSIFVKQLSMDSNYVINKQVDLNRRRTEVQQFSLYIISKLLVLPFLYSL